MYKVILSHSARKVHEEPARCLAPTMDVLLTTLHGSRNKNKSNVYLKYHNYLMARLATRISYMASSKGILLYLACSL